MKTDIWAAPIVPVLKGMVRFVCGNFKVTVNQVMLTEFYLLPRVDELVIALAKTKYSTKLDLSNTYLQFPLHESSKDYLLILPTMVYFIQQVTIRGVLFPQCSNNVWTQNYQGLCRVSVYLHDVLIKGRTSENTFVTWILCYAGLRKLDYV